jgi:hypothetical protein
MQFHRKLHSFMLVLREPNLDSPPLAQVHLQCRVQYKTLDQSNATEEMSQRGDLELGCCEVQRQYYDINPYFY